MSEEPKQAATQAATKEAAPVAAGAASEAKPIEIPAELKSLVAAEVEKARAQLRDQYEKGDIAKLKSALDKAKAQLAQRATAASQQARTLMQAGNADEAARILAAENEALVAGTIQEQHQAQMEDWIARVAQDLGIPPDDPAVAQVVKETNPYASPDAAWDYQQRIAQEARKREKERADKAQKELLDLKQNLPALIKGEVVRLMAERGVTPTDAGAPGAVVASAQDELMKLPPRARMRKVLEMEREAEGNK